jgi:hypothetical protein
VSKYCEEGQGNMKFLTQILQGVGQKISLVLDVPLVQDFDFRFCFEVVCMQQLPDLINQRFVWKLYQYSA